MPSEFEELRRRLESQSVTPRVLLGDMRLLDESSRSSGQYQDPDYLPFYYHVARAFGPRRIFCLGLELGLHVSCLLKGCSDPDSAVCVQPPSESFYSPRLALSNIRSVSGRKFSALAHEGRLDDPTVQRAASGSFDLSMITVEAPSDLLMEFMDFSWSRLRAGGLLLVDRLVFGESEDVFDDFRRGRGADAMVFETRYRTGLAIR